MLTGFHRTLQSRGFRAVARSAARRIRTAFVEVRTELVLVKSLPGTPPEEVGALCVEFLERPSLDWISSLPPAWQADAAVMTAFRTYVANQFGGALVKEAGVPIGYFWWTRRGGGAFGGHPH